MGGKKRDQDEDAEERPHGLAGSHLDPDKRPRLSATSRTRTTSETIDLGAVTRAGGEAYGKGAHPYYIGDGVINGWEEYAWLMKPGQPRGLRERGAGCQQVRAQQSHWASAQGH